MKKILILLMLCFSVLGFSQEVKLKNGIVYIDGKECMKYDKDATNVTFQDMNGDDIIILKYIRTNGTQESLYEKVIFVKLNKELTTKSYIFTKSLLIEKLVKSNAIVDCVLNEEKVNVFILKYDEKVEERLRGNSTNTIIINEEPRKSGVNINIGR